MSQRDEALIDRERLEAIARCLKRDYGAERILLFGSFARGEGTEDSDIDLLVIARTTEKFHKRIASVLGWVRDLSFGLPLSPIVLTEKEIKARLERGDQFIEEILSSGIEL